MLEHRLRLINNHIRVDAFLLCHFVEKGSRVTAVLINIIQNLLHTGVILKRLLNR